MNAMWMDDLGKLLLRVSLGVLFLLHGVHKIFNGIGGIENMVAGTGLPSVLAYGVYVGEVLAPLLIIFGLFSRVGGVLVVITMIVAIALVHPDELTMLTGNGGWALELQWMFLIAGAAVALSGPGRFAINQR